MIKATIDTNVLISALLIKKGNPRKIFNSFRKKKYELAISPLIFAEFLKTLEKPKIKKFIKPEETKELIKYLEIYAQFFEPEEKITACRDPKDNIILECAVAGKVDFIVTGDKDLLKLQQFRNIKIVSPKTFLRKI